MAKMKIHPVASLFPPMGDLEFESLKEDLKLHGLRVPILLSSDGRIVDGRHRYRACTELKITPKFSRSGWDDDATLAREIVSLNLKRRHLTESQLAIVGARLRALFEADAKKRAQEGRAKGGAEHRKTKKGAKATPPKVNKKDESCSSATVRSSNSEGPRKAAEDAANKVGVSTRLVESGVRVLQFAIPALIDAVERGLVPVAAAARISKKSDAEQKALLDSVTKGKAKDLKDAERKSNLAAQLQQIAEAPPVEGKFEVLVVDPPWSYNKTRDDDSSQRGRTPYPTMTEEQIKAIKLPEADSNCILWLWTTNAHLASGEAARVIEAWGYNPKSILTWAKNKMGLGDWLRGQTEHCILATKGRPVIAPPVPSTLLHADVGVHSSKPDAFYELVEAMCPGTKGELFARRQREGWNQHGVELPKATYVMGVDPAGGPDSTVIQKVPVPEVPVAPAGTMPPIVAQPIPRGV